MSRHAGSAACANAARKNMIARLGYIEVMWREAGTLTRAGVAVVVIRDQSSSRGRKQDRRRWYAAPEPVDALRALENAGLTEKRIVKLLDGPKEELDRELALGALAGHGAVEVLLPVGWSR